MYKGWMTLGGNEVINVARTMSYVESMIPMLGLRDVYDSADLAVALLDPPYSTPLIDEAPWVDPDIPETYGFAGLYPLSIIGVDDSTVTARVTQNTGDGGSVGTPRRATREMRVSGLLLAVDDAALDAGFSWLKSVLNGAGCNDYGCTGDDLCFMASTPHFEPLSAVGDLKAHEVPLASFSATGASEYASGVYSASGPESLLVGVPQSGVPRDTLTFTFTFEKPPATFTPGTLSPSSSLFPGDLLFPGQPPGTLPPGITVLVGVMDEQGMVATATTDSNTGTLSITIDTSSGDYFIPVVKVSNGQAIRLLSVTAIHREIGSVDDCIEPSIRNLYEVTCIDGPRIIEEYVPSTGAMCKVEFTLVANVPYIYGVTKTVASGDGAEISSYIPGADVFPIETMPLCIPDRVTPMVYDPSLPAIPDPPRPPAIATVPVAGSYNSFAITIPSDAVPMWEDVVPTLSISTGGSTLWRGPNGDAEVVIPSRDARNVRVRMVPRPLERFGQAPEDLDPCSACDSFFITYIPPNSTITIDGVRERVTIEQTGGRISNANHLILGADGGPFEWSSLSCGTGYFLLVDIPKTNAVAATLSLTARQ